jgi:hypothetical protein
LYSGHPIIWGKTVVALEKQIQDWGLRERLQKIKESQAAANENIAKKSLTFIGPLNLQKSFFYRSYPFRCFFSSFFFLWKIYPFRC